MPHGSEKRYFLPAVKGTTALLKEAARCRGSAATDCSWDYHVAIQGAALPGPYVAEANVKAFDGKKVPNAWRFFLASRKHRGVMVLLSCKGAIGLQS